LIGETLLYCYVRVDTSGDGGVLGGLLSMLPKVCSGCRVRIYGSPCFDSRPLE